jgi:opacity protein-like surface antigen
VLQEDGDLSDGSLGLPGGGEVEFDDGFGVAVALGYDLPVLPLSLEFEYSFRNSESETLTISGLPGSVSIDADLGSHTFMANAVANIEFEGTPIGIYGAVGAGFTLSTVDVASIAGLPVDSDESDITPAYQLRAGVTFRLTDDLQLFAGARWFDALEPDFDGVELENASIDIEMGLRFYF